MRFHLLASGLAGGLLLAGCDDTPPDRVVLEDVAVSGHRFVAVGAVERGFSTAPASTVLLTSTDGLSWQTVPVDARTRLSAVAAGDGVIVAAGGDAYEGDAVSIILRSTDDGETWVPLSSVPSEPILDIAYGDGVFVAAGPRQIQRSDDGGQSWHLVWTNSEGFPDLFGIRVGYGAGVFIRTDQSESNWISRDGGATWERDNGPGITWVTGDEAGMVGGIVDPGWNSGDGSDGPITAMLGTSKDGYGWTESPDPPRNDPTSYAVLGDQRIAPGRDGLMLDDGNGWALLRDGSFSAVALDGDRAVVVGTNRIVLGTAAGEWTDATVP